MAIYIQCKKIKRGLENVLILKKVSFPIIVSRCWFGDGSGIQPVKKLPVVLQKFSLYPKFTWKMVCVCAFLHKNVDMVRTLYDCMADSVSTKGHVHDLLVSVNF